MNFAQLPSGSLFYDVDSIPVAKLPSGECVAFNAVDNSRRYPRVDKVDTEGDLLSREEFEDWLKTGRNKFDV